MQHRTLSLERFIRSVNWDYFQRYFERSSLNQRMTGWEFLNADAMRKFLEAPENAEVSVVIKEDFKRINDISENGMSVLIRACTTYNIKFDSGEPSIRILLSSQAEG